MNDYTLYHNPACPTSRNALQILRHAGIAPRVVEYLRHPPSPAEMRRIAAATGRPLRELVRDREDTPYAQLGLADPKWTDDELIDFMQQHPVLFNRPVVETPRGARLCRPVEDLLQMLPEGKLPPFTKEDGGVVHDTGERQADTRTA